LKGLGDVPSLANKSPIYLYRQLNDMQTGARSGAAMALMKPVVEKLTPEDMLALAAYMASLEP
jgi:cytochrome c553